jgi:hypothetical protein
MLATHRRHDVDDTSLRRRMFLAWRDLRVARAVRARRSGDRPVALLTTLLRAGHGLVDDGISGCGTCP